MSAQPLAVKVALAGSVMLASAGLCVQLGVFSSMSAVGFGLALLPLIFAAAIALLIVAGGEMAKAKLLEWARDAEGWRKRLAYGGWAFFVALSISLQHTALVAGERAMLAPVIAPLDASVERASLTFDAAHRAENAERSRIATQIGELNADIEATPDDSSGRRERERLRAERSALRNGEAAALLPFAAKTEEARQALAEARAERAAAPKGFNALTVTLPFVGSVAVISWLLPFAIEYLTGLVGWIAAPRRREPRSIAHSDILTLDPAGLELLETAVLEALGPKLSSLKAKRDHVVRGRMQQGQKRA